MHSTTWPYDVTASVRSVHPEGEYNVVSLLQSCAARAVHLQNLVFKDGGQRWAVAARAPPPPKRGGAPLRCSAQQACLLCVYSLMLNATKLQNLRHGMVPSRGHRRLAPSQRCKAALQDLHSFRVPGLASLAAAGGAWAGAGGASVAAAEV